MATHFFLLLLLAATENAVSEQCEESGCIDFSIPPSKTYTDKALQVYSFKTLTDQTSKDCFSSCTLDCRCVSFNFISASGTCHLLPESGDANSNHLTSMSGVEFRELEMDSQQIRKQSCDICNNFCCVDNPCFNGGTCKEVCNHSQRRFNCSCPLGFKGELCQEISVNSNSSSIVKPSSTLLSGVNFALSVNSRSMATILPVIASSTVVIPSSTITIISQDIPSCLYYLKQDSSSTDGIYTIRINGVTSTVQCNFRTNKANTLVMSYSYENNGDFKNKPLYKDAPFNDNLGTVNKQKFRLSKSAMEAVKADSVSWFFGCGVQGSDSMKGDFATTDLLESINNECKTVTRINLLGITQYGQTVLFTQKGNEIIRMIYSSSKCTFRISQVNNNDEFFGKYDNRQQNHMCSQQSYSLTRLYFIGEI